MTAHQHSLRPHTASAPLAWTVLAAAALQAAAPFLTLGSVGGSPGSGSTPDLLVQPAGWAFAIWGLIYALAIIQAAVDVVRVRATSRLRQTAQVVLYLGGTVWLGLSTLEDSRATAAGLTLMLVAALVAVQTAQREDLGPVWRRRLTRTTVGTYGGWVTAAFFLNLGTALVDTDVASVSDSGWQIALLCLALASLLAVVVTARGPLAYGLAGAWALVGITATALSQDTTGVLATSLAGIVLLLGATAATRVVVGRRAAA